MAFELGFAAGASESGQPDEVEFAGQGVENFDQLKGQFLASLNHELRTPLSGVIGMADLLRETSLDSEQQEYVETVRECAHQLLETLNAVLEYSALSSGSVKITQSEFSLPALLAAIVEETRARAGAKGLTVSAEIGPQLPELVEGDARHLRQVLQHLLRNAVKFTGEGGIVVRAKRRDSEAGGCEVEIAVSDSGIGIPPAKMRLIFEAFRQLDNGLARSFSGLGLGLALAHRIAGMLGGSVSVESEPGRGSTFTLCVPLRIVEPHGPAAADKANGGARPWSVLVVEDNRVAQQVVSRMLERAQCKVTLAGSGGEGIEKALAHTFDLILMDMQMPGMDGLAATRAIRQAPHCQRVPIVALTANTTDEDREACFRAGMQGFLSKPVHREDLLASISALVSRDTPE